MFVPFKTLPEGTHLSCPIQQRKMNFVPNLAPAPENPYAHECTCQFQLREE